MSMRSLDDIVHKIVKFYVEWLVFYSELFLIDYFLAHM